MRADDVALRADAEQLAFDRVEVVLRIELLGEHGVERFGEPLARPVAVDGRVLEAVGDPHVGDARRAERPADRRADPAAGDAVVDPELADPSSRCDSVKPSAASGCEKQVGLKSIPSSFVLAQSIQPRSARGRSRRDRPCAAELAVERVQVEAVAAGDAGERLVRGRRAARRACAPCRDSCR